MLFGVSFGAGSGRRLHCIWNVTSSLNLRLEGSDKRKNTIIQYDDTIYNNIVFEGNLREGPGRRMMMTMMTMTMMMMMMMMVYFGVIRKRNNGNEQKCGKIINRVKRVRSAKEHTERKYKKTKRIQKQNE